MKRFLVLAACLLAMPTAFAAVQGDVGAYLWKGAKDTGGIGIQGHAQLGSPFFVHGMLENGDRGDKDSTEIRLGGGVSRLLSRTVAVWGGAEFIKVDFEATGLDESGFGLFGGAAFSPANDLWLTTEFGIVDVDDTEGSEWAAGMAYAIAKPFSLTLKRREAFDGGITDTQIGVSYSFGGM